MKEDGTIIELKDEEDVLYRFDHVMTFEHGGEHFIALLPIDEVEGVGDDEVMIMHIESKDGEDTYLPVEDDKKLQAAFQTFLEILEEEEDELDEEELDED
ncbi:MAG: DUF1292 domain-containing protein [Christensenellales bacterium]|jgi:hypothetical protein